MWYDAVIMTTDEIKNLGSLARIALSDAEAVTFNKEIDAILEYVSVVKDITAGATSEVNALGARYNVLRSDTITNTPGQYTEDILRNMPQVEGRYLSVKKILKPSE